jgi:hypothetical protein
MSHEIKIQDGWHFIFHNDTSCLQSIEFQTKTLQKHMAYFVVICKSILMLLGGNTNSRW